MQVPATAPAPAPEATSQLLATLKLFGNGLSAPLTSQQDSALVNALKTVLGSTYGVQDLRVLSATVRSPLLH